MLNENLKPYFIAKYSRHNKIVRHYNYFIQQLRFGRQQCSKWWKIEHTWHDFKTYYSFNRDVSKYGIRRAKAIWLKAYQTPLSKRRYNIIKQMERASHQAKHQGKQMVDYLKSTLILLEHKTPDVRKMYLFKPLIALRGGHLGTFKVSLRGKHKQMPNILDNKGLPIIDTMARGKHAATHFINTHRNRIQILNLNTEFKPRYEAEHLQTTDINVHAQGLGFTTVKYTKNEQRHVEAIIKHKFCKATGYPMHDVIVSCPAFTNRSTSTNQQMILDWTDIINSQEKYPLLNQHLFPLFDNEDEQDEQLEDYDRYIDKQTRIPPLPKGIKHAKNDLTLFKQWKFNKEFIFACDNAVHHNLKWSIHFNQRTENNYTKIIKFNASFYWKLESLQQPIISTAKDKHKAAKALNMHHTRIFISALLIMQNDDLINEAESFVINCSSTSYLSQIKLDFKYIFLIHQNIITKSNIIAAYQRLKHAKSANLAAKYHNQLTIHNNSNQLKINQNTYTTTIIIMLDLMRFSGIPPPLWMLIRKKAD